MNSVNEIEEPDFDCSSQAKSSPKYGMLSEGNRRSELIIASIVKTEREFILNSPDTFFKFISVLMQKIYRYSDIRKLK